MPDANALNYLALQDAVLGRRFPAASQRANAKRWLATAYQDVWSADDWAFKRVSLSNLSVTAGDSTPTMPADFADTVVLFDANGSELQRLSQEGLDSHAAGSGSGSPYVYSVVNRQITLAPNPGATTLKLSYRRRLASRTLALVVQAGFMSLDTDYPLWDDHHSLLIPRATAIGLAEINDPTWEQAQTEYERQLARMKDDYTYERPQKQWGRVSWSA